VDRVERHDILNALGLALVLLAMALSLVFGARALFRTVNGGLVDSSKPAEEVAAVDDEEDQTGQEADDTTDGSTTTTAQQTTTAVTTVHVPSEVLVRVGNGARRGGIASAGTSIVEQAGYPTLSPKNAPSTEASIIYFVEGYQADAIAIARLLNVAEAQIAMMPADPGIPQNEALLVVILGADTTVG
jgi:hypothetical protein